MGKNQQNALSGILFLVLVVVLVGVLLFVLPGEKPSETREVVTLEQQVVNELSNYDEIKPYANARKSVKFLSEDELNRLKNEQPAIYGDVPMNAYEVDYDDGDSGILVIYDFEHKEILKIFAVQNFNI